MNSKVETNIDTYCTDTCVCPYCGSKEFDSWELADGDFRQNDCSDCEKTYIYSTEISRTYTSQKADCLNGAPHQWGEWVKFGFNQGKTRRCSTCGEREYKKEDNKEPEND